VAEPEATDGIDVLEGVLAKTEGILGAVTSDQHPMPTPCPDYDVAGLVGHLCSGIEMFAAGANGEAAEASFSESPVREDPAADFAGQARRVVAGWRAHGLDRSVLTAGVGELPGPVVVSMTIVEYLAHGWDLAQATGQAIPFTEAEGAAALERAQATLPPQYRGENKPFGDIVEVPASAGAVDRFVAFMGRNPNAATPTG
jgi:uncharacterized protein (TIGR03086 family)